MRTLSRSALAAATLAVAGAAPAAAQVQNGSFESPTVSSYQYLSGPVASWTYTGGAGLINTAGGPTAFNSRPAVSGDQVAFVQGMGSSISQGLASLTPGAYSLAFSIAGRNCNCGYDGNTSWNVFFGGNLIGSGTTTSGDMFTLQTFAFSTAATAGTLSFENASAPGDHTFMLDDVSLSAAPTTTTPEPASIALVGGGLLALGGAVRRRRHNA